MICEICGSTTWGHSAARAHLRVKFFAALLASPLVTEGGQMAGLWDLADQAAELEIAKRLEFEGKSK